MVKPWHSHHDEVYTTRDEARFTGKEPEPAHIAVLPPLQKDAAIVVCNTTLDRVGNPRWTSDHEPSACFGCTKTTSLRSPGGDPWCSRVCRTLEKARPRGALVELVAESIPFRMADGFDEDAGGCASPDDYIPPVTP